MDYGLILIVAAYLGAIQLATRTNTNPLVCSFVAVGIPYIVGVITHWILIQAHSVATLADLFPLNGIVTFVLQFIVAFIVFKKVQDEDSITSLAGWSMGGFVLILMLIPFVVEKMV